MKKAEYEFQPCTITEIFKIVAVYRLILLKKKDVGVGELPGFRGIPHAYTLHHLNFMHHWTHFWEQVKGRLKRLILR